jgi:hypothetical protein
LTPEEVHTELARKYFTWFGPASAAEFQRFSGLGVKAAKAAIEPLKLEGIQVAPGEELLLLPGDRARLESFKPPKEPHYALLGSIDSLFEHRGQFQDFEGHAIVDRGRLVGVWEYDQPNESIAWVSFVNKDKALQQAVTRTEEFVRQQLGDARSFSLDSPKSRAPRIAALRKAAGA